MNRQRLFVRLEPERPAGDPRRGFSAELADSAWMLGRQWQMGEHQGEDASSPLVVHLATRLVPIEPLASRPGEDPARVPAESIIESGPDDWWTIGRRARLGQRARESGVIAALAFDAARDAALRFDGLSAPYDVLNGVAYDGRKVHPFAVDDPVFAEVPRLEGDAWRTDLLAYVGSLPSGAASLVVGGSDGGPERRWGGHDGGELDWWSVDAEGAFDPSAVTAVKADRWPDRFRWPGAPAARWWEIEDHTVDLGGIPPDRAHLASTMLLDLLAGHADDWFLVPVAAAIGYVLSVESLSITDSFDETWPAPGSDWSDPADWSLFRVEGLGSRQLPIWPIAAAPLTGDPIDDVVIGVDEDANLVWAVEERLNGTVTARRRPAPAGTKVTTEEEAPTPAADYRYTPITAVPDHWHPYTREDRNGGTRFVQGRLVDIDANGNPERRDPPTSALLASAGPGPHVLAPWRLPPTGVRLETRVLLARTTTGDPVLWVRRQRRSLLSVPASGLRFDALGPLEQP